MKIIFTRCPEISKWVVDDCKKKKKRRKQQQQEQISLGEFLLQYVTNAYGIQTLIVNTILETASNALNPVFFPRMCLADC